MAVQHLGIHEELHRLILNEKWHHWYERKFANKSEKFRKRKMRLVLKLIAWKPTWWQRVGDGGEEFDA